MNHNGTETRVRTARLVSPLEACVHDLVDEQCLRRPRSVAVQFKDRSLTYGELSCASNRVARVLASAGVRRGMRVGLFVERSIEMITALLGILKTGAAYVPVESAHGTSRLEYIAGEGGFTSLITNKEFVRRLPDTKCQVFALEDLLTAASDENADAFESAVESCDLAYIIYTSGSTGKPKGVQIEHRSVVNFLHSMQREPGLSASDVLLAVTTLAFDIAGLEILGPLSTGGRVVLVTRETGSTASALMQALESSGATVMQATPATWRLLLEAKWGGNPRLKALVGGVTLPVEMAHALLARTAEVWNLYGPTETTIWSSIYRVTGREQSVVPIGRPIDNTQLHILDGDRSPVPAGQAGELYIGGEGLARGYFNREDLTAERFVPDPFSTRPGARLYRTGDLARRDANGDICFLGRSDHQIKLRGFRIELGEIESLIAQYPGVRQCVVVLRDDQKEQKILVAYLVSESDVPVSSTKLRAHLAGRLPEYMWPAAFVRLAALPLTPNGKTDRANLPAPRFSDFQDLEGYLAPTTTAQRKLAAMWQDILGVAPIGIRTSFFELGGHSLLAARLFMNIRAKFGKDLPTSTLFQAPTIEELAKALAGGLVNEHRNLVPIQTSGTKPPFFCVHGGLGGSLFLNPLASYLDKDQPVYALESDGLDGQPFRYRTIEEMASSYIQQIKRVQPLGPYYLGGYCLGGVVAFEIAQQLVRNGDHVGFLGQFSAPLFYNSRNALPNNSKPKRVSPSVRSVLRHMRRRLRYFRNAIQTQIATLGYGVFHALERPVPQRMRTMYVVRSLTRMEQSYIPKPYQGTVHAFYAREGGFSDPYRGWAGLAKKHEIHVIGDSEVNARRAIMDEPLVRQLAAELSECLAAEVECEGGQIDSPLACIDVTNG